MDTPKYSTLLAALQAVPDPRQARGKRHAWSVILTVIVAALVSGQKSGEAMAHWAHLHASTLMRLLPQPVTRLPSASTLRRALHHLDITALEETLAAFTQTLPLPQEVHARPRLLNGAHLKAQAVDGKIIRTASAHGAHVALVSLVVQGSGRVLAQDAVGNHEGEQAAVERLLARCQLRGSLTTLDAGLTTPRLAQQIRAQEGHYLMIVKRNQPAIYEAIAFLFDPPEALAFTPQERAAYYRRAETLSKGHGRLETRVVESSPFLNDFLDWPGLGQVMRRTCRRLHLKTGKVSQDVTYGLTSLGWDEAGPELLEQVMRGHWTIENRSHYVRDVTLGEDRCPIHVGHAPQALAALRNGLIGLLRAKGWSSIAHAVRFYAASVADALALISAPVPRL